MKLSRLVIGFLVSLIVVYSGIIGGIQSDLQIKIIKRDDQKNNESKKETILNKSNSKTFLFVNLGSKLLNNQHQFPLNLKTSEQFPSNGRIRDLLNYYYSKGHTLYTIESKTLKTKIKSKNKIFYQPKIKVLKKIYIENITINELKTITNQTTIFNKKLKIFLKDNCFQKRSLLSGAKGKISKNTSQLIYQLLRKQIIFKN